MDDANTITLTLSITREMIDRCRPPEDDHEAPLLAAMAAALPGCDPCTAGLAYLGFRHDGWYWSAGTPPDVCRWLAGYVDAGDAGPEGFAVTFRRSEPI